MEPGQGLLPAQLVIVYSIIGTAPSVGAMNHYIFMNLLLFTYVLVVHIVHVILCFFTGYNDKATNHIIMNQKAVIKKYLSTFFLPEVLSIVPLILVDVRMYNRKPARLFKILPFLLFFKLCRIGTWLEYLTLVKHFAGISDSALTTFKMIMAFVCIILWVHTSLWHIKTDRWAKTYFQFCSGLEKATELILNIGPHKDNNLYVASCTLCLGFVFQLIMYVWMFHIWMKFNSVSTKRDAFSRELEAYMSYKTLPVRTRQRVKTYFDFKFQKLSYKDSLIESMMSTRLNQEIAATIGLSSVNKVDLFKNLPEDVLIRFSKYVVPEIYLHGDVIVREGTIGDAMYFILAGTVEVTTPEGDHVCFLEDGTYFGEIALILQIRRVANVTAVTPCEMLRLNRNNFLRAFKYCPEQLNSLKEVANSRMADLTFIKTESKFNISDTGSYFFLQEDRRGKRKSTKSQLRASITASEEEFLKVAESVKLSDVTNMSRESNETK